MTPKIWLRAHHINAAGCHPLRGIATMYFGSEPELGAMGFHSEAEAVTYARDHDLRIGSKVVYKRKRKVKPCVKP